MCVLFTGWHPPDSGHGDVLWLSVPPGPDRGPWPAQGGSYGGHGHDRRLAGHDSVSPLTACISSTGTLRDIKLSNFFISELKSLWELDETLKGLCYHVTHLTIPLSACGCQCEIRPQWDYHFTSCFLGSDWRPLTHFVCVCLDAWGREYVIYYATIKEHTSSKSQWSWLSVERSH